MEVTGRTRAPIGSSAGDKTSERREVLRIQGFPYLAATYLEFLEQSPVLKAGALVEMAA